jgi:chromate transporter
MNPLLELAKVFFRLGVIGFGGPAAHIAMMEDEAVEKRKWLDQQQFLDLVGATNLIPGPNSTEMVMHLGYLRGGFLGLLVAGICFITPAVAITAVLAWAYVTFGTAPEAGPALGGIQAAVIPVIGIALYRLGRKALTQFGTALIAMAVGGASMVYPGIEIYLLLGGAVAGAFYLGIEHKLGGDKSIPMLLPFVSVAVPTAAATGSITLLSLGWTFLKVGSVLYGSGYVLFAFLEGDLVHHLNLLTEAQLLDAVAAGQVTPGPILSTATFIGYVIGSAQAFGPLAGAAIATTAIFLPSFLFVLILSPLVPKLRRSKITALVLDAVNAAAVGLMAAVSLKLASSALADVDPDAGLQLNGPAIVIAALSAVVLIRWKINPAFVVVGGAVLGLLTGA